MQDNGHHPKPIRDHGAEEQFVGYPAAESASTGWPTAQDFPSPTAERVPPWSPEHLAPSPAGWAEPASHLPAGSGGYPAGPGETYEAQSGAYDGETLPPSDRQESAGVHWWSAADAPERPREPWQDQPAQAPAGQDAAAPQEWADQPEPAAWPHPDYGQAAGQPDPGYYEQQAWAEQPAEGAWPAHDQGGAWPAHDQGGAWPAQDQGGEWPQQDDPAQQWPQQGEAGAQQGWPQEQSEEWTQQGQQAWPHEGGQEAVDPAEATQAWPQQNLAVPPPQAWPTQQGEPAAPPGWHQQDPYPGQGPHTAEGYPADPAQGYAPPPGYPPQAGHPGGEMAQYAPTESGRPAHTAPPPGFEPQVQYPQSPSAAQPFAVPPTAEEFAARRAHRPIAPEALMGVPALVRKATFGIVSPPPSRKEVDYRESVMRVRRNFGGLRQITVVNPKGGAGKTVAVLMTAMTFGQSRGGYILAWDNNETQGTLGMRAQQDFHTRTVRDVLHDLGTFTGPHGKVGDLSSYVRSQGEAMFDVLASDESATAGEMLTANAFRAIREVVDRFYKLIIVDTGNNVRAENWQAAIDATDQLVVTMSARGDSAETAARMLDHLEQTGRDQLVRQAVSVIAMPASRKGVDLPAIQRHFAARTRAVLVAPYEPLLDSGEPIRYGMITHSSRTAWLRIAASISEGL